VDGGVMRRTESLSSGLLLMFVVAALIGLLVGI
jgi:hypothetical protein